MQSFLRLWIQRSTKMREPAALLTQITVSMSSPPTGPDSNTFCWKSSYVWGVSSNQEDIQQMFYCFFVRNDNSKFLKFLWFRDNDPMKDITEYRRKVHGFGNSPFPTLHPTLRMSLDGHYKVSPKGNLASTILCFCQWENFNKKQPTL